MAFTAHNLPTFKKAAGADTWRIILYVDNAIGALTVPVDQTIKEANNIGEILDDEPSVSEISNAKFAIKDYYKDYSEGFWYKALDKDAEIRVQVDEATLGTYKTLFHGRLNPATLKWKRRKRAAGTYSRRATFEAISLISTLKDVNTSDWITEILAQDSTTGLTFDGVVYSAISLKKLIAALMKVAFNTASFDEADCELIYDTSNPDIEYKEGATWYKAADVYIPTQFDLGVSPTSQIITVPFFKSSSVFYLANIYKKAVDLLPHVVKNFGFGAHIYYDDTNSRYRMQLIQRGRAYSGTITISPEPREFDEYKNADLIVAGAQCVRKRANSEMVWVHDVSPQANLYAIPPETEFDITIVALWIVDPATITGGYDWIVRSNGSKFTDVRYWRYDTGATATTSATNRRMQEALASYYYYKFKSKKNTLELTYKTLKGTSGGTSISNIGLGRRMTFDSKNYYINEIRRDVKKQEMFIQLVQE